MNKAVFLAIALMAIMSFNQSFAQSNVKTESGIKKKQSFAVYVGGGLAQYVSAILNTPVNLENKITKSSAAGTIRIMWQPGFRLNLGIESGYTNLYSYRVKNGNINGDVNVNAVPLLIVWSMHIVKRVAIFAGLGSYILTTHLNYNGAVKSTTTSLGSNIALTYTQPISKNLGIAAEAKWMNAYVTKDDVLSLQVLLVWKFFK